MLRGSARPDGTTHANQSPCGSHRQMGQLFMMGFDGTVVSPQIRSLIEDYHLGSVLLSAKNLKCITLFSFSRLSLSVP